MRETVDFRIDERYARRYLKPDEGVRLGELTRKVVVDVNDPLYERIGELDRKLRKKGKFLFGGRTIRREYSTEELDSAELFRLIMTAMFEPAGEQCNTVYDESSACKHCRAGRRQVSELRLDLRRIPKGKDIAFTIARDEWVVSDRLATLMRAEGITGAELRPVTHAHQARKPVPVWHQLVITSKPVPTVPPTRFGISPFDDDPKGEERCPLGHVAGLRVLSELWLSRAGWDGSDFCCTKEMTVLGGGLIMPVPEILISPRLRKLFLEHKITGYRVEVAHLV